MEYNHSKGTLWNWLDVEKETRRQVPEGSR